MYVFRKINPCKKDFENQSESSIIINTKTILSNQVVQIPAEKSCFVCFSQQLYASTAPYLKDLTQLQSHVMCTESKALSKGILSPSKRVLNVLTIFRSLCLLSNVDSFWKTSVTQAIYSQMPMTSLHKAYKAICKRYKRCLRLLLKVVILGSCMRKIKSCAKKLSWLQLCACVIWQNVFDTW